LLEEYLTRKRDEMMEIFFQILQWLLTTVDTYSSRNHFGGIAPFKVQVNFYILMFEGQIYINPLGKWLNILEGYFSIYNFYDRENMTFMLLKVVPHVKNWWETYREKKST
jgi:hypothetical protein